MAEFLDSGVPGIVVAKNGLNVDRDSLGPGDTVIPMGGATPSVAAQAPIATPAAPATPMSPAAAAVIAKRDAVLPPSNVLELAGSQTTTSTQKGIAPGVLNPILEANTARAGEQAAAVTQAGEERAGRREAIADRESYLAQGRQAVAAQQQEDAQRRAAMAHQNELALSLQKDPSVDPGQFVRNMSTGTSIGTVILAALNGAFKGMVGQQGNDVMDILSRRIQQDIDSQKEQIASGRVRRGNLIAYFQNQGLREDAAEKAAEATSWAMADRMAAAEREKIGAGEDRTAANLLAEQLKSQTEQKNDELKLTLGQDRTTTQNTRTMQQRTSGTPGAAAESFTKLLNAREAYEKSGATPEELARFDAATGMPSISGQSELSRKREDEQNKRSEDQTKAAGAVAGMQAFAEGAGLVIDPKTGEYRANPSDKHTFNARQRERAGSILPGGSVKLEALADAAIEGFGRVESGGAIQKDEAERFKAMIASATTDKQLAERLNAIMTIVTPRLAHQDKPKMGSIPYPEASQ